MAEKKSIGVYVLGILILLSVYPALSFRGLAFLSGPTDKTLLDVLIREGAKVSPFIILIDALGLLMFKKWARILTLIISPAIAFISVDIVSMNWVRFLSSTSMTVIMATLCFGTIFYLTRPKISQQFH